MRKRMKNVMALGLVGIMMGALAACGGNESNHAAQSVSASADHTSEGEQANRNAGEPVILKFSWWGNQNRHEYTIHGTSSKCYFRSTSIWLGRIF